MGYGADDGYTTGPYGDVADADVGELPTSNTYGSSPFGGDPSGWYGRTNVEELIDSWANGLVEPSPETNIWKLLHAFGDVLDHFDASTTEVTQSHHVGTATDDSLAKMAKVAGIRRQTDESDADFRRRIVAKIRASTSGGTFGEILEFLTNTLGVDENDVSIFADENTGPAEAQVSIFGTALDDTSLTLDELKDLLNDLVAAGHEITMIEEGTFELKADGDTNDPSKGLTSDGITTGGTLTKDI